MIAMNRTTARLAAALLLVLAFGAAGCDFLSIDDRPDPNGPSLEGVLGDPTLTKIANLAVGVEAAMRPELGTYYVDVAMIGREAWRFSAADPRFTGDLLGRATSVLDNNTFYITRPWGARYRAVRNANILLEALAASALSESEKRAGAGFAKTIIAYQVLSNLNLTYDNGVRVDVAGEEPGPVVPRDQALAAIATLLNEAAGDLRAGGAAFPFPVSDGFAGFDTPSTFRRFNRALAARVAVYRGDFSGALGLLPETFLNAGGDLKTGVYHAFSSAPGDEVNPIFFNPDSPAGDAFVAHPSYVADLEAGDNRISKVFQRTESATLDGLTSEYGVFVYKTNADFIPIIRNAELVLIRAEARIQTGDLPGGASDLDVIRNAAGLPDYAGDMSQAALLDEMLKQRRYELFNEGHRWIDLRRYNRLGTLPLDRAGDDVWDRFPIPATENV